MAAVTITHQPRVDDAPAATHDAARVAAGPRRPARVAAGPPVSRTGVGGSSPSRSLVLASVVVTAQAGAALGGSPSLPPSAARSRRPTRTSSQPGRLAVVDRRAPRARATTRARSSTRWRGARHGAAACPARHRLPGETVTGVGRCGPRCDGRDGDRYGGAMRCPFCPADDDKVVDSRPADDGARGPAPAGVPRVRAPLHHLRAGRGAAAGRGEALGRGGAVRPREARGRASSGRSPAASIDADGRRRARRRDRGAGCGPPGPRCASERVGLRRARAAAGARPGLVPALRLGLQGLRGPRRLRARGRRAPEDDRSPKPRRRSPT